MKILAYTCCKRPYHYLTVLRYLFQLPEKSEDSNMSPRDRIIRYLFNLDGLTFEEFVMLVSFSIRHSFDEVKVFFDHYYCNQWKEGKDYTGDSIVIYGTSVYGKVKKNGALVYAGCFRNRKYYGNGIEYMMYGREIGMEVEEITGYDMLRPKIENHKLKGWFQEGKKEGCFEYYSDGKSIREQRFYLHGRRCGVQTSFFNSSADSGDIKAPMVEGEKVFYDGEANGEVREFRDRYYRKRGYDFHNREAQDMWVFKSPHICCRDKDSKLYYLPTPGMEDSIKEYGFGQEYLEGEPLELFSPDLLPHFRCFSLIDGEWGHICGDDDDESRVVVSTEMIQYYFKCIGSLPKEDKFACVNDRNNTAKKDLVYGDRTETLQMKDLETLLAKQTLMEELVLDCILFPTEAVLNLELLSLHAILIRSRTGWSE